MKIHRLVYQAYANAIILKPRITNNKKVIKPRKDVVEISASAKEEYDRHRG